MAGFLSSLGTTAGALSAFEKALTVVQNNVANALTPGFAKQRLYLEALPFQPEIGFPGGVRAERIESARQQYAEQAVRARQWAWARAEETAAQLSRIEGLFDVSGQMGIPKAITALFQAFSAWTVSPNDMVSRQAILERAQQLADRFRETASALAQILHRTSSQIQHQAAQVNRMVGQIRELNVLYRQDIRNLEDPSLDARLHALLEELAQVADFTAIRQQDGSVTILLGGQTPLLVGEQQFEIAADVSASEARILDFAGRDITAQVTQGRLGAQLEFRNRFLPSISASLDRLAAGIADRINGTLAGGLDLNGQPGAPLFAYDSPGLAAATLRVTSIGPEQLAAATPDAPGGNGNALALAALAESAQIEGFSFIGYYGWIARRVGSALEDAREATDQQKQMLLQTQWLRERAQAVSLDEEAVNLVRFQRAYEAAARVIRALDELLETVIGMVR
ncbi:MAG: flagellar hook-associated protein FlgK [Bryobacterales bacterium]|nr:flagellar hook-associated protein FlgK [Bryobacteraceae bacterium]MDW8130045.1 flagellar hook-associated protein FlgK [Bryobacterales bacterium]